MAKKKLTRAERALDAKMLAILEYATRHPRRWHSIGLEPDWRRAAQLLAERGVIEIRQPMNQYRLIPAKTPSRAR
jgi:hypothetical protein